MDPWKEIERLGRIIRLMLQSPESAQAMRRLPDDVAVIVMEEADTHGVSPLEVLSPFNRSPAVMLATRAVTVRLRALEKDGKPRFTWAAIARYLGRTNHTTMMYAAKRHQERTRGS